jgi:allantoinase
VHLSSAGSLGTIRNAKDEGLPITAETCPHYLCLEAESVPEGATEYKCAPPIRDHDNREALWSGLFEGVIDFVITDHSPCVPGLKRQDTGNFLDAWGGISSLSLGLCAVWTEARRRGASLEQLSKWMSQEPARFAGLASDKGEIAPGKHADLVVWDPDEEFEVSVDHLHFRHKLSPYVGRRLRGRVHHTFARGREVFDGTGHPAAPGGELLLHRVEAR